MPAIPRAHATRDWLEQEETSRPNGVTPTAAGCCFAERCPVAVPACVAAPPGLYRTEPRRAVACVQYRDYPMLDPGDPGAVLSN